MRCICCNIGVLDLGCLTICDTLTISYIAPTTQTYTLVVEFNGQLTEIKATITAGNLLIFDISGLNEDYIYTAKVLDENLAQITFTDGGGGSYDCFRFKTGYSTDTNPATIPLS